MEGAIEHLIAAPGERRGVAVGRSTTDGRSVSCGYIRFRQWWGEAVWMSLAREHRPSATREPRFCVAREPRFRNMHMAASVLPPDARDYYAANDHPTVPEVSCGPSVAHPKAMLKQPLTLPLWIQGQSVLRRVCLRLRGPAGVAPQVSAAFSIAGPTFSPI